MHAVTDAPMRKEAVKVLRCVLARALNPAEWSSIEAWMEARSEEEGGYLWLLAHLGMRPSVVEEGLRLAISANPRQRSFLKHRLARW